MVARRYLTVSLIGLFLLAGCSKPRPSVALLDGEVSKELPGHLSLAGRAHQYSAIHEVLGTTLPEGSYQVDIQCTVSAKESLYICVVPSNSPQDSRLPLALVRELEDLKNLTESLESHHLEQTENKLPLPRFNPFLASVVDAGATKDVWVKVVAEPRGKEWLITMVEGQPQATFSNAKPRAAFDRSLTVYGSTEQRQNVAEVQAAYGKAKKREAVLKELAPRIAEIRSKENDLANQYFREAGEKMARLREELKKKGDEHDRLLAEINRATSQLKDDYKTRDGLVREESKRWHDYASKEMNPRMLAVQEEAFNNNKRAKEETEKRVQALLKDAGLES